MTNEEWAHDLIMTLRGGLQHPEVDGTSIGYVRPWLEDDEAADLVLAYADEIRQECNNSLRDVRDKLCGIELNLSNYSDADVRELQNNVIEGVAMLAAIMGRSEG